MKAPYNFKSQLRLGQDGEEILDNFFYQWYSEIRFASASEENRGIDRIFFNGQDRKTVQYKTDFRAKETGNAYVETISRSDKVVGGWAYTSEAQWLIYFVYPSEIYCISMDRLRKDLPRLERICRTVTVPNQGYFGAGLIVPLEFLRGISKAILEVKK